MTQGKNSPLLALATLGKMTDENDPLCHIAPGGQGK